MRINMKNWTIVILGILGTWFMAMSLILGFAAASHYEKILSNSLKYEAASIGLYCLCLAISGLKYRWVFLVPITILLVNHLQAVNRLTNIAIGSVN
jgi:hypothetical protein